MKNIIKKVAKQHGVSVKEVRKDFEEMIKVGMSSTDVYTARTATRARSFCPPLPLTAHGHCPEKCDILDMARNA